MNSYPVGVAVTVTIPFVDFNGDPVTPTALSYAVEDQNAAIVVPSTPLNMDPADTEATITVPGASNMLASGISSAARVVRLTMTTAAGTYESEVSYLVRGAYKLVHLKNSFQTYLAATLVAADMLRLDGWNEADDALRQVALIQAFQRLTRFGYLIRWPEDVDAQSFIHHRDAYRITPLMWPLMNEELWSLYPDTFKAALNRAQVVEANHLLLEDPANEKRRAGVLSESIGESSMMFRMGKPLELGLARETLDQLTGFIDMKMTLTRA